MFLTGIHGYCDAPIDVVGATLDVQQLDGSVGLIMYVSLATLHAERPCAELDLEDGSILFAL